LTQAASASRSLNPSTAPAVASTTGATTPTRHERDLPSLPRLAPVDSSVTDAPQVSSPSELSSVFPTARIDGGFDILTDQPQALAPGVGGFRTQLNYYQVQGTRGSEDAPSSILPPSMPIPQTFITRGTEDSARPDQLPTPRIPAMWMMNPYAAALIEQAELQRNASTNSSGRTTPQGSPRIGRSNNPFLQQLSASPDRLSPEPLSPDRITEGANNLNLESSPPNAIVTASPTAQPATLSPKTSRPATPNPAPNMPRPSTPVANTAAPSNNTTKSQEPPQTNPTSTKYAPPDHPPPGFN
jgi:hypothetical protein